jgi:hypothetical protein
VDHAIWFSLFPNSKAVQMATTTTLGTVVGVFSTQQEAQKAVNALRRAGYADTEIGVVSPESGATTGAVRNDGDTKAEEGAVAGVATGAGLGALWGLGILAGVVPGIGPAIAGGTLAALLSSAAAGAAAAGVTGALVGLGIPDHDAEYYDGEYRSGRTIVTVHGPRATAARAILDQNGALPRA